MNDSAVLTACIVIYNNDVDIVSRVIDTYLSADVKKYLVLFDNGSQNGIFGRLRHKYRAYPNVHLISSEKNIGFGAGHNRGFEVALDILKNLGQCNESHHYHLVLNPDVVIHDGCLEKMISHLVENGEIGLLVPKVLNTDGTIQKLDKRYPTVFDLFIRRFLPKFISRWKFFQDCDNNYTMNDVGYDKICNLEFASGCFMLFRASIFRNLDGFDERFFLYMEDADISRRANSISKVVFYPEAVITHIWARESHKKLSMTILAIKSAILYFDKYGWKIYRSMNGS